MPPIDAGQIKTPTKIYTAPTGAGAGNLADQLGKFLSNIMGILTVVAGLAFLFYFILGAVGWLVSAGEPEKIKTSRAQIMNALIGLVITVTAYPIVYVLGNLLGIPIEDPTKLITSIKFTP
jgi:hypothetical protein